MVHYSFANENHSIVVTVSASDYKTAVNCLSEACKDFKQYLIDNISFDIISPLQPVKPAEFKPLGLRLNNPLNIRYNKRNNWVGQKGEQNGFCVFFSPVHGFRAALRLLCNYVKSGFNTIETIIARFAPSIENTTDNYIKFVCKYLSIKPTYRINNFEEIKRLCWSMCLFELGYQNLSTTQLEVLTSCLNIASANYKYPIS